jgi:hypothetical protein
VNYEEHIKADYQELIGEHGRGFLLFMSLLSIAYEFLGDDLTRGCLEFVRRHPNLVSGAKDQMIAYAQDEDAQERLRRHVMGSGPFSTDDKEPEES